MCADGVEKNRGSQDDGLAGQEAVVDALEVVIDRAPAPVLAPVDLQARRHLQVSEHDFFDLCTRPPGPLYRLLEQQGRVPLAARAPVDRYHPGHVTLPLPLRVSSSPSDHITPLSLGLRVRFASPARGDEESRRLLHWIPEVV